MGEFSVWHLLIVLVIVLLVFGPKRLPDLGNSLGKAIRSFKDGVKHIEDDPVAKDKTKTDDEKKS